MPRASRKKVRKEIAEDLQDNFAFLISSLSSKKDINHFFETFLTDEEKTMLTKRLMIHLMLQNNYSSGEISVVLNVCKETIRTHKSVWRNTSQTYQTVISKIAQRNKVKDFWKSVDRLLRPLEYALQAKTNMKARAKLMSGDFE